MIGSTPLTGSTSRTGSPALAGSPALTGDPPPGGSERAGPAREHAVSALERFNAAPRGAAEAALLGCCRSSRWARRLADHRPYPDVDALLAAADEAGYDLTPADLAEALDGESAAGGLPGLGTPLPPGPGTHAAHTALRAAHAAYESRFGHLFVICTDGLRPSEVLGHVLAEIRRRLGHEPEEERTVAADELRRTARGRLGRLVADRPEKPLPGTAR
ncbi:2-oxo-4-hydroxy-4-carboxy-5-ureidoimidazoline decarboxylase [Streptomyces sp. NPDC001922]|uniref:2-oxo-4-hydroxy-4-carboxy-5-ureidoimidazoline decarboxylase n=1 Tax=Streptomyces sp. NPDC001922 TaxID=3364624 RepID=UPI00367BB7C0